MKYFFHSAALICIFLYPGLTFSNQEQEKATTREEKVSVEDVIPLTVGGLRWHKMMYNEGWHVVTSSSKALDYAKGEIAGFLEGCPQAGHGRSIAAEQEGLK